jgi:peptidoglycan/LPS O-acetylase OafA/YrhL
MFPKLALGTHAVRPSSAKSDRIPALDFTKGALVLLMVLYHWLNYFIGPQGEVYRYLRFLTPAFIFVTGFLISNVHLRKYEINDLRLGRRLARRGLKVLGLFILLNQIIALLIPEVRQASITNILAIYVTGNTLVEGVGKIAVFSVLVPISYLLLLSACLSIAYRSYTYIFHVVCVFFWVCILVLDLDGLKSGNLELLSIGLLGVAIGCVPIEKINSLVGHPHVLLLAYVGYTTAITIWDVVFPLQVLGVCLSLILIYMLSAKSDVSGRMQRHIILLGRYSLFGYIVQIAILQVLRRGLQRFDLGIGALGLSFFAALALTIVSVEVLDRVRGKVTAIDRLYKAVFA